MAGREDCPPLRVRAHRCDVGDEHRRQLVVGGRDDTKNASRPSQPHGDVNAARNVVRWSASMTASDLIRGAVESLVRRGFEVAKCFFAAVSSTRHLRGERVRVEIVHVAVDLGESHQRGPARFRVEMSEFYRRRLADVHQLVQREELAARPCGPGRDLRGHPDVDQRDRQRGRLVEDGRSRHVATSFSVNV